MCTGDIVSYVKETEAITIIDRKKNIFKLSQSEFVAPEKLEILFIKSPYIANCFVYGNSLQSYVLAVIVPDFRTLKYVIFFCRHFSGLSFGSLCAVCLFCARHCVNSIQSMD